VNFSLIDWIILGLFCGLTCFTAVFARRITKTVAGFLSAERCAGRYLLTISFGMAYVAAASMIGSWESGYRNGLAPLWWKLLGVPIGLIVAMSGWVTYRYRQTRALTMAQFFEMRYSWRFRIFGGITAFFSGVLNCAVFPMITAQFVIHFCGIPEHINFLNIQLSSFHCVMFLLVGAAVLLAVAGGQIAIMLTDFLMGTVANLACIGLIGFIVFKIGTGDLLETLLASETANHALNPEHLEKLSRIPGTSMLNPFKIGDLPDFGIWFFIMLAFVNFVQTGVWQGGAGYLTAARTPHEGKMGNVLGTLRWTILWLSYVLIPVVVYVVMWNPDYEPLRAPIIEASSKLTDPHLQSQMFVPIALGQILPAGLLGLFAIFLLGASISTDDSYYHSWGSTFLQDVIMPFRKKPFTPEQHLKYLRWCIVGVGAFAFTFSSIWELRDYIQMWFQITASIYIGGACCAVIGGLYWSRGTTQGAWAGMITGSALAVTGIVIKQIWPDISVGGTVLNGQHLGVFSILVSICVYTIVSLITCRQPHNMDQLLHRGKYKILEDEREAPRRVPWVERLFGITSEFTKNDRRIFFFVNLWMIGWAAAFVIGTAWNLTRDIPSESWFWWWKYVHLPVLFISSTLFTIWFGIGSIRDVKSLLRHLKQDPKNLEDDGFMKNNQHDLEADKEYK
jgi:SSS family solute:Na+ symporter